MAVGIDGSGFVIIEGSSGSPRPRLWLCGVRVSHTVVVQELGWLRAAHAVPLGTVLTLVEDGHRGYGGCAVNVVRSSEHGQRFRRVGRTSRLEG